MYRGSTALFWKDYKIHIDLLKNIFSLFLSADKASEVISGIIQLENLDVNNLKYNLDKPIVYVVDNCEWLSEENMKLLCKYLEYIKTSDLLNNIGIVLISNKQFKHLCPVISEEIPAPPWTDSELLDLLKINYPDNIKNFNEKYIEWLQALSAGHPLIAKALVRKYPDLIGLVKANFQTPSLIEEDLSEPIKIFLFEDILKGDNDASNFITRMSALIFRAKENILVPILTKILPPIGTPLRRIMEKLLGTVIEGDNDQGYIMSYVYKKVAEKYLNNEERKYIYKVLSAELLSSNNRVLEPISTLDGITYSILAEEYKEAFLWTAILLHGISKQDLNKTQIKYVIGRLDLIAFIEKHFDSNVLYLYYSVILGISTLYINIGEYNSALMLLEKINTEKVEIKEKELSELLETIIEVSKFYKATAYAHIDKEKSKNILSNIDLSILFHSIQADKYILEIIKDLVTVIPVSRISVSWMNKLINTIDENDYESVYSLMSIASTIGFRAKQENLDIDQVIQLFDSNKAISDICKLVFKAQYYLESKKPDLTITCIEEAFIKCDELKKYPQSIKIVLYLLEGDAYLQIKKEKEAKDSYLKGLIYIGDNIESFDYAWANYRLGLYTNDSKEAITYFKKASASFRALGIEELYARSEGEKSIAYIQNENYPEFIKIIERIYTDYFINDNIAYAPACTIAAAHLARFVSVKTNKPLPEGTGGVYPEFVRGIYANVLNIAKPSCGGLTAFYKLAESFAILGNVDKKLTYLRIALSFNAKTQLEKSCEHLIIYGLLNEIIPYGKKEEIEQTIIRGINIEIADIKTAPSGKPKEYISFCLFSKIDKIDDDLKDNKKEEFILMLSEIQEKVGASTLDDKGWWLAEIGMRKARIGDIYYRDEKNKYSLWKDAYDFGKKYNNDEVIIQAGNSLFKSHYKHAKSFKEMVNVQFSIIESISLQNERFDRLYTVGKNMFNIWKIIDDRHILMSDIHIKLALIDGARTLSNSGIDENSAAPVMILLLSSIYQYEGPSTDWVVSKIKENKIDTVIPEEIKSKIQNYL